MAATRKKKNYITTLETSNGLVHSQHDKQQAVLRHFQAHLGNHSPRQIGINFASLGWEGVINNNLDARFTEEEIENIIRKFPKEKAPGPDGFIGIFFKTCWSTIKPSIMLALDQFYNMNQQDLHFLNQAYIVLVPKKTDVSKLTDFRPISHIHSFAKIIAKVLANRLAPLLPQLISMNQNGFIKKRCIHDNFLFVQQVVRDLHKKKTPALFIKLDISKAFDTVNWAYLLDIMTFLGFSLRWRNWISALWGTTSSSVLVNGEPGPRIRHLRGVRQGDPLSPMIFLLAMEPLHRIFQLAQSKGLLHHLQQDCANFRMSLYADDAALFIAPKAWDLQVALAILDIFGQASGLMTNIGKTEFYPIRCQNIDLEVILGADRATSQFPCS